MVIYAAITVRRQRPENEPYGLLKTIFSDQSLMSHNKQHIYKNAGRLLEKWGLFLLRFYMTQAEYA